VDAYSYVNFHSFQFIHFDANMSCFAYNSCLQQIYVKLYRAAFIITITT